MAIRSFSALVILALIGAVVFLGADIAVAKADCNNQCDIFSCMEAISDQGTFYKFQNACTWDWTTSNPAGGWTRTGSVANQNREYYGQRVCQPNNAIGQANCGPTAVPGSDWTPDTCAANCRRSGG